MARPVHPGTLALLVAATRRCRDLELLCHGHDVLVTLPPPSHGPLLPHHGGGGEEVGGVLFALVQEAFGPQSRSRDRRCSRFFCDWCAQNGERWVCATLARYGWAPALTRDGIARTDIPGCRHPPGRLPTLESQVKAANDTRPRTSWPLGGVTCVTAASEREWFVFVPVPRLSLPPRAFVVLRDHVSPGTWIVHKNWRTDPSAAPGKRNAGITQARIEVTIWKGYEDRWDLLGTPTGEAPVLLPAWLRPVPRKKGSACRPGIPGTSPCHSGDSRLPA